MQHQSQRLSRAAVMMEDTAAICKKIVSLKQQAASLYAPRCRPLLSTALRSA
jgi:hypothetical protein